LSPRSALRAVGLATLFLTAAPGQSTPSIESSARGLLEAKCQVCHGAAHMSDLDLRDREGMLKGGKRGPAIVPGHASDSLLYKAVLRDGELQMPPGKGALTTTETDLLRKWIDGGAQWNATATKSAEPAWWAFRKPMRPAVPAVKDTAWVKNPIDAFILSKLEEKGLQPVKPADRGTLIRRAYFDLHGLPPTPQEVEKFVKDPAPDAYEKLIDRLLDSPRYGERWGRYWLDVVRYADTGGFETDVYFANAWRYRDYVINSFNDDKPYNTFVQEQIAGDELWPDNLELEGAYELPKQKQIDLQKRIATGLYTLGAFPVEITFYGDWQRAEWQSEAVDTTGAAFLGLTIGCARCHDHKFDPITQRDYYRMAAVFAGSEDREVPIVSQMGIYEYTRYQTRQVIVDQIRDRIRQLEGQKRKNRQGSASEMSAQQKDERDTLMKELAEAYMRAPIPYAKANMLVHTETVPETHVLVRGDYKQKGEKVEPGFPAVLNPGPAIHEPKDVLFIAQRRKALAQWITSPDQPLFARVMVNRIWQGHFGVGIVATPNDFGRQGDPPSHPELLDWLATEFAQRGYSMKQMHRLIMLSNAYRLSSQPDEADAAKDSDNHYFWRFNRQRLEAEELRDSVLAVSGNLNLQMGGPAVAVPLSQEEKDGMRDMSQWPVNPDPAQRDRRSVYLLVKRSFRLPMFETFDAPDPAASCPRRETSTIAPQALALMNSEFINEQAAKFAARLQQEHPGNPEQWVDSGWLLAFGHAPSAEERAKALEFLKRESLPKLCLLWLNMSEFIYVD
jgi:Protein of unknown function (DUF1553)/Protein of unknown function (DUF1549)/Planctomycete cytochrome C